MAELKECRHIMPSGLHCKSPAMRGSVFCYFHGRRIPPARKSSSTERRVEIPATLDRDGIDHALSNVLQALANGQISARRASMLLYGLQMAAGALAHSDWLPASAVNPFPGELFSPDGICDDETISMINSLAEKLGLDLSHASLPGSGPKG